MNMNGELKRFLKENKKSDQLYNQNLIKQIAEKKIHISFSQNYEDVVIKRLFPNRKNFFYVDVGASSPIINSNTMMFYLEGCHGINIEAQEKIIDDLKTYRKRDINVLQLVHSSIKLINFNYHKVPSRSSAVKKFIRLSKIGLNKSDGKTKIKKKKTDTLNNILKKNRCPKNFNILNIDVEGAEYNVLKGLNLNLYKPKVLIIETEPPYDLKKNLKKNLRSDKNKIKNYLNKFEYKEFYRDVLNTWYCKKNLYYKFSKKINIAPAKIIDNYITYTHYQSLINNSK